jgi:hypothetical protein
MRRLVRSRIDCEALFERALTEELRCPYESVQLDMQASIVSQSFWRSILWERD